MIPSRLIEELERWIANKKYGEISIKFNAGQIVHMTRTESLKVMFTPSNNITSITATAIHQPEEL